MKKKRWLTPENLMLTGVLGGMFTAGSFSGGTLFLTIGFIGCIWETIRKRKKRGPGTEKHGNRDHF